MTREQNHGDANETAEVIEILDQRKGKKNSGLYKFLTIVVVCLTIIALALIVNKGVDGTADIAKEIIDDMIDVFSPRINIETIIMSQIDSVRTESKVVVSMAFITTTYTTRREVEIFGVPNPNAKIEATYRNNKVQFIIRTDDISYDYRYDRDSNILYFSIPEPTVDQDIVEVQTNPDMIIVEINDNIFMPSAVEDMLHSMQRNIRAQILRVAEDDVLLRNDACSRAEEVFTELLESALRANDYDTEVIVTIETEAENDQETVHSER